MEALNDSGHINGAPFLRGRRLFDVHVEQLCGQPKVAEIHRGQRQVNELNDKFPVLQSRRTRSTDDQKLDEVRRVLWHAFQHETLSEEELASTLERLEFATREL